MSSSPLAHPPPPSAALVRFLSSESAGGAALVAAAALAMLFYNSPLAGFYEAFLATEAAVQVGDFAIRKPLLLWINDGLMAIFFLLVGLELKREFLEGELSTRAQALFPAACAIGGMAVPAIIYVAINAGEPENLPGWAIPAATDIAFSLGVLAILGARVPASVKVLLMAIAVFDDLGAIIIIALFYTDQLSLSSLVLAAVALAALVGLNLAGVSRMAPYIIVGVLLWVCVLKSGVHATLAGVALAFTIPKRVSDRDSHSPLRTLEHGLHPWVAFFVLPLFAFANAGVSFDGITAATFTDPVKLGIFFGLFLGKPIGIAGTAWVMIRRGIVPMPTDANLLMLLGMSCLAGIGFTMSLFIGGLAWEHAHFYEEIRLGVILGSLGSAIVGLFLLTRSIGRKSGPPR